MTPTFLAKINHLKNELSNVWILNQVVFDHVTVFDHIVKKIDDNESLHVADIKFIHDIYEIN